MRMLFFQALCVTEMHHIVWKCLYAAFLYNKAKQRKIHEKKGLSIQVWVLSK